MTRATSTLFPLIWSPPSSSRGESVTVKMDPERRAERSSDAFATSRNKAMDTEKK